MQTARSPIAGIAAALFLTASTCTQEPAGPTAMTDARAVAADKSALSITYLPGDSAESVTRNVGLPDSGVNGSGITWTSTDSVRIAPDGLVSRPRVDSADVVVTLTATLSRGTASDVKAFELTVKKIVYTGTMTDADGNVYHTMEIGSQVWTVENLRTETYNDGSPIPFDTSSTSWGLATTPKYCYYGNSTNADSIEMFGALYNWYAVNSGKLAPAGWRIPDTTDWNALENYLIANGYNWDGTTTGNKIAQSLASESGWGFYTIMGTIGRGSTLNNRSGFTALPGGSRYITGFEENIGYDGCWWSATEYDSVDACYRYLFGNGVDLRRGHNYKACGFSVRLVRE